MDEGIRSGLHFGLTSGVITTLGLIVGLHSGTHSLLAVLGGILTIAVADALSDALGIHISKEADKVSTSQVWKATGTTFVAKFVTAATFIVPILLLPMSVAIFVSIAWGFLILALLSYSMARSQGTRPLHVIGEHLGIALIVVISTHFVGEWIARVFADTGSKVFLNDERSDEQSLGYVIHPLRGSEKQAESGYGTIRCEWNADVMGVDRNAAIAFSWREPRGSAQLPASFTRKWSDLDLGIRHE